MTSKPSAIWFLNHRVEVLRATAEHADGVSVLEITMPFGDSPPLHLHHHSDEIFTICEGVIRFRIGGDEVIGRAGDLLIAPAGVPHSFRVESADGARVLVTTRGPDFEGLVRDFGRDAGTAALPPLIEVTPVMASALTLVAAQRGIAILGPPLDA